VAEAAEAVVAEVAAVAVAAEVVEAAVEVVEAAAPDNRPGTTQPLLNGGNSHGAAQ